MESQPDHWFRRKVFPKWNKSREAVANLVGADVEDLVFMTNTTSGIHLCLRLWNHLDGLVVKASQSEGLGFKSWQDHSSYI